MSGSATPWMAELEQWLMPFLAHLGHDARRRWAPLYIAGLLLPGERKSLEPMVARVAPGQLQQMHHFLSSSRWDPAPLEAELVGHAEALVGGPDAVLVVDDTALPKKGEHSVGVAHQWCGQLGKQANCQALVSLTLARAEVPVCVALRLFLPAAWAGDEARRRRALVPPDLAFRGKWLIALSEIDRVRAAGATFGCVLADADYGRSAPFRQGLDERGLSWAVGILPNHKVYPAEVRVDAPRRRDGRPRPSCRSRQARAFVAALPDSPFRSIAWRHGTKGPLRAAFAAVRVRTADGLPASGGGRLPGAEVWLVCERRAGGETKYYLSNLPADTPPARLAELIKARWVCEQAHQQMKEELGLDHLECRNWAALAHHVVLVMMALCFLQHLRLGGKKERPAGRSRSATQAFPAPDPQSHPGPPHRRPSSVPGLPARFHLPPSSLRLAK